jgi:glycosyltransferase involved in cell wall biosynthesis
MRQWGNEAIEQWGDGAMRILYAALDQVVPGTLGGSVHVRSVAEGLATLGHDVHVATTPGGRWPEGSVTWHAMPPPFGRPALRWARTPAVARLARRVGATLIMERYYNFGGEGVMAANRLGLPSVLEVNAPVIDYPGSRKAALDRALLFQPMRRWRDRICRLTSVFVTPSAAILPEWVDRDRVLELEWGADTDKFRPDAAGALPFSRDPDRIWCVFAGAFRAWHGAPHLASALARLHRAGDHRFGGVFIGDGPERAAAEAAARGVPAIHFTGRVPHDNLPACLAACDIGVAPFDPDRHPPLQLEFFWSPLKVFEYMAAGLPVVAPRIGRLRELVGDAREGLLYDPQEPHALDAALVSLAERTRRRELGGAARARAVREFSWQAHCRALDARIRGLTR